ncbi:hypothetical protein GQ600_19142 [Phytophthora cactorum]|nr:hypothetical protein GQ600_19142 [Phytophthora cactorum]
MPARLASAGIASAPDSASSSPGHATATSSGFSFSRNHKSDGSWVNNSQNQNADNDGSPSSSGTQDEDIRSKPARPSSAGSQGSASSSASVHRLTENETGSSQNQTLPSLSSAANGNSSSMRTGEASGHNKLPPQSVANAGGSSQNQLHSFRRVREEGNPLIPDEDMEEDEMDDGEDEEPPAPPSPSDQRDVRIMFHGREIFAEDLIGLRVAKTFAGHGRFLGQVVKFDKRVSMYTVVYADGDAEDLTVDGTLQILIQDEIERADPAQPPPSISLLFMKGEDGSSPASPDTGDFMMVPPPPAPRRARIQVSEREAQFVISLFENHALPTLVRQGWRVQTNSGRGETRFVSPKGEIFPTPLDVVGHIATDNELLTACFPANVHSAILSLLPREPAVSSAGFNDTGSNHSSTGSASRKRTTSDSPSAEQRVMIHLGESQSRCMDKCDEALILRYTDLKIWIAVQKLPVDSLLIAAREWVDVFECHAIGYRRASNRDPTMENPFSQRWSGADPVPGRVESAEYARRFTDSPGWRERGDAFVSERQLEANPRNRIGAEGRYIHRLSARNSDAAEGAAAASGTPTGYYRDATGSSPGGQASPMTNGLTYPQYSTMRARTGAPRVQRETASFMSPSDTLVLILSSVVVLLAKVKRSKRIYSTSLCNIVAPIVTTTSGMKATTAQSLLARPRRRKQFDHDWYGQYYHQSAAS